MVALAPPAAAQTEFFRIGTAGSAGAWYAVGGALSKVIGENVSVVRPRVESTKGGYANVGLLANGDLEAALVPPYVMPDAVTGKGEYAGKQGYPLEVGGWFGCCRNYLTLMVPRDSDIRSVADLNGRSVNMGNPGSLNGYVLERIVEVLGVKPDGLAISIAPAVNRLKNRQIDAIWWNAPIPNGNFVDASVSLDLRLVGVDEALAGKVASAYSWTAPAVIPAGSYKGTDTDTPTVASAVALVMRLDVDEETAYRTTKAVFEHLDELGRLHPVLKELSLDNALTGLTIPLHPGVYRYYKEKDVKGLDAFVQKHGML
jgi:TRAP transporter TAXI family solute receptor